MKVLRRYAVVIGIVVMTAAPAAQDIAADTAWLVDVLRLRTGSVVADIGAGTGELTVLIADHVTATGRVYSSEIGSESVKRLQQNLESAGIANVTVVEGDPDRTNLPQACCDAVFVRFVYHHFASPPAMNRSLWESLKPGGRLAVIDFAPRGPESADPGGRTDGDRHGVTAETVVRELTQAGFALVSAEQQPDRDVFVVVERPVEH